MPPRTFPRPAAFRALGGLLSPLLALCTACGAAPPSEPTATKASDGTVSPRPLDAGADDPGDDRDPALSASARALLLALSPQPLPAPPPDATNRFADDDAAVALGQQLFYDPSFSGPLLDPDNDGSPQSLGTVGQTGRVACASCHVPSGDFSDTRSFQLQISLGSGWGRRRAPSLLDVGHATLLMWDGRRDALYNQVFGPLESVVEMNTSRLFVAERVFAAYRAPYERIFGAMPPLDDARRFPVLGASRTGCQPQRPSDPQPVCDGSFHGMPGDHAEFDAMTAADQDAVTRVVVNFGKSIGAFERRLTCGASPFDAWIHGGAPVSRAAQRGAALFVGRGECVRCHAGAFMSDQRFHNVGLMPDLVQQAFTDSNDLGASVGLAAAAADALSARGSFSDGDDGRLRVSASSDVGAFRTPTLRCVGRRPTFMHTGQLGSLAAVVRFFNDGGDARGFPGTSELHPLGLSERDQADLVEFLESLAGPGADARYQR